jgi:Bacterial pre-peptidase C-terminal domain
MTPLSESDAFDDESLETSMNPPRVKLLERRARPKRPTRRRFAPEGLEPRYLPSVTLPGLVATDPVDGATTLQAPQSFTITFDQSVVNQVDALFANLLSIPPDQVLPMLVAIDSGTDVEIDQISDDTATPVLVGTPTSPFGETIVTTTTANGQPQTQLVVTPPPGSPALGPGTYQLDLSPSTDSALAAAFAAVEPTSAWATATQPIPIAQFTVLGQGPTLVEANDLGTIGPETSSAQGYIDPANYQTAVSLYRFTVPAGSLWQVDAQVLAHAIGSPLVSSLTLFDSAGDVLATSAAGSGTAADPIDPVLVQGLGQGTYYLGVSAAGNTPGFDYGYNPVSGQPGTAGVNEPAGQFVLDVSATPVAPPTQVVGFNLDYADSLEPTTPTGLDVTFSGPVDLSPFQPSAGQETALTVVDSTGRPWSITAVAYQPSQDRLSFVFNEPLPEGSYSLIVPSQGDLTDLVGRPVVGPAGNPPGVLARWKVVPFVGPTDQSNLGVLWPATVTTGNGLAVTRDTELAAGQTADYRLVMTCSSLWELTLEPGTGAVDVQVVDSTGATVWEADGVTQPEEWGRLLSAGVYSLRISPDGSGPATVVCTTWAVLDLESLGQNAVLQTPALSQPLITVAPVGPGADSSAQATGGSSAAVIVTSSASTGTGTSAIAAAAVPSPTATTASPIPVALLVSLETGLVGSPASVTGNVAAVGPLAEGASVALADAGPGLPSGIRYRSSPSGLDPRAGEGDSASAPDVSSPRILARSGSSPLDPVTGPEAASARADAAALALAQADPLVRIAGWFAGRFPGRPSEPREPELPASELGTTLLASAVPADGLDDAGGAQAIGPARHRRRETLSQADLGAPCALLVATALTYRLSDPVRRWWRRCHTAHALWPRPYGFGRASAAPGGEG